MKKNQAHSVIEDQSVGLYDMVRTTAQAELRRRADGGEANASEADVQDIVEDVVEELIQLGFEDAREYSRVKHFMPDLVKRLVDAWFAVREVSQIKTAESIDELTDAEANKFERWDELMEYWTPDEILHKEDIMENQQAANPEKLTEERETRRKLFRALLALPADMRFEFAEIIMNGAAVEDVSEKIGHSVESIEEDLESASVKLAEILADAFNSPSIEEVFGLYSQLGRRFRVDASALARHAA